MPGNPKFREDLMRLDLDGELVRQFWAMVSDGRPMPAICARLGLSKRAIREWLEVNGHGETLRRARATAADALVDESLDIADSCLPGDEKRAKLRVDARHWVAERWNPERYAQQRGAVVQVNLGALHLGAIKARQAERLGAPADEVQDVTPRMLDDELAQL